MGDGWGEWEVEREREKETKRFSIHLFILQILAKARAWARLSQEHGNQSKSFLRVAERPAT